MTDDDNRRGRTWTVILDTYAVAFGMPTTTSANRDDQSEPVDGEAPTDS